MDHTQPLQLILPTDKRNPCFSLRDGEQMQRVLLGRQVSRKCTAAVEAYACLRWPQLKAEGCRNYRQKLGQEIQRIFRVRLSGESLRIPTKSDTHSDPCRTAFR